MVFTNTQQQRFSSVKRLTRL